MITAATVEAAAPMESDADASGFSAEAFKRVVIARAAEKIVGRQPAWVKARKEKTTTPDGIAEKVMEMAVHGLKNKGLFVSADHFSGKSGLRSACNDLLSVFSKQTSVGGLCFSNAGTDAKNRPQYKVSVEKA